MKRGSDMTRTHSIESTGAVSKSVNLLICVSYRWDTVRNWSSWTVAGLLAVAVAITVFVIPQGN